MSHLDDVLAEIAAKLEEGIDAVLSTVGKLEQEVASGKVKPDTVAKLKEQAERLHTTVVEEIDEGEEEEGAGEGGEEPEEPTHY